MDLEDYLTTTEAGEILGFTKVYVRQLISEGRLEATKLGDRWYIHRDALKMIKPATKPRGRPPKKQDPPSD